MKRSLLGFLALMTLALHVVAAPTTPTSPSTPATFDPVEFEKRFKVADRDRDGKLLRKEAYAAFPRMPQFFDEIDVNRDNAITLAEVRRAMEKRVSAALAASRVDGGRYLLPPPAGAAQRPGQSSGEPVYSSRVEARRHHRSSYYESIAGEREAEEMRGQPLPPSEAPAQINLSF